jgi:hypothetical protein
MLNRTDHYRRLRAERHKRTRLRRKLGLTVVPVEVSGDMIELLIERGLLARDASDNAQRVGEAITRMLDQTTRAAAAVFKPGVR